MRHRKSLDEDIANRKFGAGPKDPPVPMSIQRSVVPDRFGGLRVRINRDVELPAKHFDAANSIERVEIKRVARSKFRGLQITRPKISIAKRVGALLSEEMKAQPAAIQSRNALGFAKERDEQKKHEISIDLRLEFQI